MLKIVSMGRRDVLQIVESGKMKIERLKYDLTVCKVQSESDIDMSMEFYAIGKTDEEISLVCPTKNVPLHTIAREDGWKAFRIQGVLDFSLIGVLSKISTILANHQVGIFVVSTYNTDYILVKGEEFDRALALLEAEGYTVV